MLHVKKCFCDQTIRFRHASNRFVKDNNTKRNCQIIQPAWQPPMDKSNMAENPENQTAWICRLELYPTMILNQIIHLLIILHKTDTAHLSHIVYQVIVAASKNHLAWESFTRVWTAVPEPRNIFYVIAILYIVFSFVLSRHMICLTNENAVFLFRRIYFCALEPFHGRFLFVHAQTVVRQADFLTPELLLDKLWS